jgi:hypothetical protein
MNNDIDHILLSRRPVEVPEGLAQRIINMAQPRKPKTERWEDIWMDIQAMFVIPRPAYALVLAAFFGLIIGLDYTSTTVDASHNDFTSFLSADNADLDEGNWL